MQNFLAIAAAAVLGAIAVAFINHRLSASAHQIDATKEDVPQGRAAAARG